MAAYDINFYMIYQKNNNFVKYNVNTMKHLFYFVLFLCFALLNSCSNDNTEIDDADAFVGVYSVSVIENVVWGSGSGTINDNGMIRITKLSANRVQINGYIDTQAEISGTYIFLEGGKYSDSSGYFTTSYGRGTLDGNVLTFTANQTGQLASNGVLYPYRNTSYFTAIRKTQ